jgi:GTP-binding protein EngB required for normal cell division
MSLALCKEGNPSMHPKTQTSSISDYSGLKDGLLRCIDDMLAIETIRECPCEELREKIRQNAFNLVVVGQFKRGKTSLINALLGVDILPVAVVPLTSIATIMTWGEALRIKVHFIDGRMAEIKPESLSEYVTEKGNPKNVKAVHEVFVTYPSPYLKDGVQLIDTPGVGSIYQHNTDVAYQYLPKSDAALFLLSVDQPMSKAELDFLRDVKEYANKIFFLLNKADYLSEQDLKESMEFSRSALKESLGVDVMLFPMSARLALDGKLKSSDELLETSMLPGFSKVLHDFLMKEKGNVLIRSVAGSLMRVVSQARFELGLELRSLETPIDSLRKKIAVFEEKKREILLGKRDFDILLDGETKRLGRELLDEDITRFRKDLLKHEQAHLEEQFSTVKAFPSRELRNRLEQTIIEHVRQAFNTWRALEDERLANAFEAICRRYASKINDTVDSLMKFSSDLFEIPFEAIKSEMLWSDKSRFSYKFRDEPVGLQIVSSSLTLALPKIIGDKIILNRMKEYLVRVVDMQSGRLGADFEERLDKSKLAFRWEMLRKIDTAIEGIGAAIEKGMAQRSKGEREVFERKNVILETSAKLDAIGAKLTNIREKAAGDHT